MTIGEKIKYCRKQIGITQDKLAELTGIHPVSIRKYETNKMQPQPPQLEKIAAALGVSYNALNGNDTAGLRLETVGDLMGVLMVLCNSGIWSRMTNNAIMGFVVDNFDLSMAIGFVSTIVIFALSYILSVGLFKRKYS